MGKRDRLIAGIDAHAVPDDEIELWGRKWSLEPSIETFGVQRVVGTVSDDLFERAYNEALVCPVCGGDKHRQVAPQVIDEAQAGSPFGDRAREYHGFSCDGDVVVLPFVGHCGARWEMWFGNNEGVCYSFARLLRSCREHDAWVYFLVAEQDDRVKIGYSGKPLERRRELAVGNHRPLRVLAKMRGGQEMERSLHVRFSHLRVRGEWFQLSGEVSDFISCLMVQDG